MRDTLVYTGGPRQDQRDMSHKIPSRFEWASSLGSAEATYTESWVRRAQLTQRLQYRVHKRHASKPNDSDDQDF